MIELDSCRFRRTHFTDGLGVVLERRAAGAAEKDVRDGGLPYRRCPFVDIEDDVPGVWRPARFDWLVVVPTSC
jgi:hypothetical protein